MRFILLALLIALWAALLTPEADAAGGRRIGASAESLTNTAQVLLLPMPVRTVTFCVIQGGAADETVILRGVGGSPTYATVNVAAGAVMGRSINAAIPAGGLEVVTADSAGDVTVECTYRVGP